MAPPVDVNTTDPTEQLLPPPTSLIVTVTYPDDVVLGPEMTGPGMNGGPDGVGEGDGGRGGDGGAVDTILYCLMNFHAG
jgi:hypothetical protein